MPELDKLVWTAGVAARVPGWIMEDRRSRTAFNRSFYRLYKDLPARELRAQAKEALPDFIQPRIQHEAVRRIREHKRRGDRVILLTGALDFLVEPLKHLGDELVAARLVERVGRFTGELAEPPLTADGRASLAARLAADHGVDLADCHAYGDSLADLPMLELVGHPHPINPDFRLSPRGAAAALADRGRGPPSGRPCEGADLHADARQVRRDARGLPGAGALALAEIRPPRAPGKDWLPVRPTLTGICGSDLALLSGKAVLHLATLTPHRSCPATRSWARSAPARAAASASSSSPRSAARLAVCRRAPSARRAWSRCAATRPTARSARACRPASAATPAAGGARAWSPTRRNCTPSGRPVRRGRRAGRAARLLAARRARSPTSSPARTSRSSARARSGC